MGKKRRRGGKEGIGEGDGLGLLIIAVAIFGGFLFFKKMNSDNKIQNWVDNTEYIGSR